MAPSKTQDESHTAPKNADLLKHAEGGSVLTDKDRKKLLFTNKHSSPDIYISYNKDTLWHP
jgi:2,4'-dihydroxyacetophenone dioxygenase